MTLDRILLHIGIAIPIAYLVVGMIIGWSPRTYTTSDNATRQFFVNHLEPWDFNIVGRLAVMVIIGLVIVGIGWFISRGRQNTL
jgi:hypothetical protein